MPKPPQAPLDLIAFDHLLSEEERAIRDVVREYVDSELKPHLADWFDEGAIPARELAKELGTLGVLGMHLEGYGCQGTSAVAYGLACTELEAGDSGIRSLVSVQGSLAMYAIHAFGSEEQKTQWLPAMAAGDSIGCFGLTEADFGSNPSGMRTRATRDGRDWVINGSKMWITNGSVADVAVVWAQTDDGIRGFVVPTQTPGFGSSLIHKKMSLRASVTSELVFDGMRLPADAMLPGVRGLRGPLSCLNEARFGIVFGTMGAARDCLETAIDYSINREQFDKPIAAFQLTQKKLADMETEITLGLQASLRVGRLLDAGKMAPEMISLVKRNNCGKALEIARTARDMHGGNGIQIEYHVMRHAANLETVNTYEGTHDVHALILGRAITGISAF